MTIDDLIQAIGLPDSARLNQRVPKKLLAEHGSVSAADKWHIQDGVEEVVWLAALKPHLIGVSAYQDESRHYLELAVLSMTLKPGAKLGRLAELLHRAVPYPVLLMTSSDSGLSLSLSHVRASQNEPDKYTLDGQLLAVALPDSGHWAAFLSAMALARQPQADLFALYQGWMDCVTALDIAAQTGCYQASRSRAQAEARHAALQQCRQVKARMAQLRTQAEKEKQLPRQVLLNQELRSQQAELEALQRDLLAASE